VIVIVLGACADSSDKSSVGLDHSSVDTDSTRIEKSDTLNEAESDRNENIEDSENETESDRDESIEDSDDLADDSNHTYVDSEDDEAPVSNDEGSKDVRTKGEYLEKLNEMEEADRYAEVGTTIADLEEQEAERYEKWDQELNKIYDLLTVQLRPEEMDDLREEQRDWIDYRDETAKESSLEYEGGSTEALEYVATQATLTRERCYLLVSQYME